MKSTHTTVALLCLTLLWGSSQAVAAEVSIAVAANFTDAARQLVPLFEQATGHTAKVSYGSTGKLYAQIRHGAPYEVFLAADTERPVLAEREGMAVTGTRFVYAKGRLVLWSSKPALFDDGESFLKGGAFKRLAMANPKTAPYGLAARQVMEHLGIWSAQRGKVVRGESIAQTFQFVVTGNAEAGFVAYSQLKAWTGDKGSSWVIPAAYYTPIEQAAVLLIKGTTNPAAQAFLDFLHGASARAVIEGFGYGVD